MRTKDNNQATITMPFEGEVITNDGEARGKRVIHKKYRLKN